MDAKTRALIKQHIGLDVWEQGKARARELVKETADAERRMSKVQWSWGDLTLEVVPIADATAPHGIVAALTAALVDDYGLPWTASTLRKIRYVCAAWPKARRSQASFDVHKVLAGHPERFSLITDSMTRAQALEIMGRKEVVRDRAGASAIDCAVAVKGWARSLYRRIEDGDETHEDLVVAATDAWYEMTKVADRLGVLGDLLDEYEEREHAVLLPA